MLAFLTFLAGVTGFEPAKTGFGDRRPSYQVLTPVAVVAGVEPVPPDRQSGTGVPDARADFACGGVEVLPLDSATTFKSFQRREHSDTVFSVKEK